MPFARKLNPDTGIDHYLYSPTSGTSVTGSDDAGNTLAYTAGEIIVNLNGIELATDEYTATNGTSVTGLPTLVSGDKVAIQAIQPMGIADVYSKVAGDAKYALLGANSDITSLSGITTPLSEAQGGTGLTSLPTSTPTGWIKIEKLTASTSASLDFETGISSTYDDYMIIGRDFQGVSETRIDLRVSLDGGSTYKAGAADYMGAVGLMASNSAAMSAAGGSGGDTNMQMTHTMGSASGEDTSFMIFFSSPSSAQPHWFHGTYEGFSDDTTALAVGGTWFGVYKGSSAAFNGFRIMMQTGNIASGTATLYGLTK